MRSNLLGLSEPITGGLKDEETKRKGQIAEEYCEQYINNTIVSSYLTTHLRKYGYLMNYGSILSSSE